MIETDGLFDLQVNGFAGVDFNDASLTPEAFEHALLAMAKTGVSQCLPTLITATRDELMARFAALDHAVASSRLGQLMVPGYHLEGPFLNPAPGFRGCHPPDAMIAPDIGLIDALGAALKKPILLVTVAPELPGAEAFIRAARERGIVVAVGHSDARLDIIQAAVAAGASLSTHLGNGIARPMDKFDNTLLAQLGEDRLAGCLIADGIHVPVNVLQSLVRGKGLERCILVTDATAGADASPGMYGFAGMRIQRGADGSVRQPGSQALAGSGLRLDQAVRNAVAWGICSFADAVAMASRHPRAAMVRAFQHHAMHMPTGRVVWHTDHHIAQTTLGGDDLLIITGGTTHDEPQS